MSKVYALAIDIGASSGRHILGHMENGKLLIEEIYRFRNAPAWREGHLAWDADGIFNEILNGLRMARASGKAPSFIGIDTWGVDYALLDASERRIGEVYCYRDKRTEASVREVSSLVPPALLYAETGTQFQPFNTIFQLYADKMSGKLSSAASLLMLPDYFGFLLTGRKKQEYTNATTTGLMNPATRGFHEALFGKLGLPLGLFQPLAQPGSALGPLRKEIASAIGFEAQVILPCTHDTASAVFALPSLKPAPYISSGTWSLLGIECAEPHLDEASRLANFTNEGSVGGRFRYQKNIMGLWMIQRLQEELGGGKNFGELAALARLEPIPDRLDVDDERFLAPSSMAEEIKKAVGRPLTLGQMAYCVFASLAVSYASSLWQIEQTMGARYERLHIIGGGSQNDFLNELTAQAIQRKVIAGPQEGTAIGNLLAVMMGAGLIKSEAEAKRLVIASFPLKEVAA
jgi:rhamnulokinase